MIFSALSQRLLDLMREAGLEGALAGIEQAAIHALVTVWVEALIRGFERFGSDHTGRRTCLKWV